MIRACTILGLLLCVIAPDAWAQQPSPAALRPSTAQQDEEAPPRQSPLLRIPSTALGQTMAPAYPGLSNYPLELLGLLMAPLERREVNLVPSLAISEEFNDNIGLNNANKQYDFITGFTPALLLLVNQARFQLAAGVANESEIYARQSSSNDAFARQNLVAGMLWEPTPFLTLTATEVFLRDQSPDATVGGFSLGGEAAYSNVFTPGLGWQLTPHTRLGVVGTYSILRFEEQGSGIDSDTYGIVTNLGHAFTPRFAGMIGYSFSYLDLRSGHGDNATTHTPTVGFSFRLTPALSVGADGGPAFTKLGDEDFITPAYNVGLLYQRPTVSAGLVYSRNVAVAGGFGGPTDSQTVSGAVLWSALRDLLVVFNPAWTKAESLSDQQIQRVDISLFTLSLGAAYRLNHYVTIFGGYSFLLQRVGSESTTPDFDADQNRVKFGIQFGYPFAFDLGK